MTNEEHFSYDDGVICKRCSRLFHFGQVSNLIQGLTFPKGDFSIIRAKCPKCYSICTYDAEQVKKSSSDKEESELVKQLRGEVAQLTIEKETIRKLFDDLLKDKINSVAQKPTNENDIQDEMKKSNGDGIYH